MFSQKSPGELAVILLQKLLSGEIAIGRGNLGLQIRVLKDARYELDEIWRDLQASDLDAIEEDFEAFLEAVRPGSSDNLDVCARVSLKILERATRGDGWVHSDEDGVTITVHGDVGDRLSGMLVGVPQRDFDELIRYLNSWR